MEKFAVIDTETNWDDQVMSIGTVIADADDDVLFMVERIRFDGIDESKFTDI